MDGLRWFLLFFGLVLIVGVYFYTRRESERNRQPQSSQRQRLRREPSLDGPAPDSGIESADAPRLPDAESDQLADAEVGAPQQKIVTLRVVGRNQKAFAGDKLALSLRGIGMRHGKFGIFHRLDGNDDDRIVFSAASLVEPGSFDLTNVKDQEIPGISLFMVLPGPVDGAEAFDLMMAAARTIAQSLDAELLDESGSTLSIQRERYLREEIVQYQTANLVH
jgi:cell division protein ZipA